MIANKDPIRKLGVHWGSFLDRDERETLFFFSIHLDHRGSLVLLSIMILIYLKN